MKRGHLRDGRSVRILEVYPDWDEAKWCREPHLGYLLSGSMTFEFLSQPSMAVSRGDVFEVPRGCAHKARSRAGARVFVLG